MTNPDIQKIISEELEALKFEKVSDLTKDEFAKLLSDIISRSIETSVDKDSIIESITDELQKTTRT